MLTTILLISAGLVAAGVGLALYAERDRRTASPPAGTDIPSREELPFILNACIGAKIAGLDFDGGTRFLAGAAYWKAKDEGLSEKECIERAMTSLECDLEIRIVE